MAFITTTFLGLPLQQTCSSHSAHSSRRHLPIRACSKRDPSDDNFRFPPFRRRRPDDFQAYDGSQPLLPAWRPPSVEADFLNCARRVASRERDARVADRKVVKVESRAFGVLYAEVVQEVQNVKAKVWLRPLILNSFEDDTFLDLRGGSDIVLDSEVVEDVDSDTRLRLSVNLLATEGDVVSRAISDDDWNVTSSKCVMKFLQTLSLGGPSDLHE